MHVTTGPSTTYAGPPGPGNKTLLVMSPVPTFTLVGKHPSSPSQHGSTPPRRDSNSVPQPEDTGALSPLRVDRGGVSTNQSPSPCCPSTTAQESIPSLPPAQLDPPHPAGLGLPTVHRPNRRPISRPSPDQHLPTRRADSPLRSGEPGSLSSRPGSFLQCNERYLHVSPDPPLTLGRWASDGVTWTMPC